MELGEDRPQTHQTGQHTRSVLGAGARRGGTLQLWDLSTRPQLPRNIFFILDSSSICCQKIQLFVKSPLLILLILPWYKHCSLSHSFSTLILFKDVRGLGKSSDHLPSRQKIFYVMCTCCMGQPALFCLVFLFIQNESNSIRLIERSNLPEWVVRAQTVGIHLHCSRTASPMFVLD